MDVILRPTDMPIGTHEVDDGPLMVADYNGKRYMFLPNETEALPGDIKLVNVKFLGITGRDDGATPLEMVEVDDD